MADAFLVELGAVSIVISVTELKFSSVLMGELAAALELEKVVELLLLTIYQF